MNYSRTITGNFTITWHVRVKQLRAKDSTVFSQLVTALSDAYAQGTLETYVGVQLDGRRRDPRQRITDNRLERHDSPVKNASIVLPVCSSTYSSTRPTLGCSDCCYDSWIRLVAANVSFPYLSQPQ